MGVTLPGMFGGAKHAVDPALGELERRGGSWHGSARLGAAGSVPVTVPGGRSGPDRAAAATIAAALADYENLRKTIAEALADHRSAYEPAVAGPLEVPDPRYATVVTFERQPTVELGYQVPWDDDHTLGARIRDGRLLELNGSV